MNLDFEPAMLRAARDVIGPELILNTSYVHITQSPWRRAQSEGLRNAYRNNEEVAQVFGELIALCSRPAADVEAEMTRIRESASISSTARMRRAGLTAPRGSLHVSGTRGARPWAKDAGRATGV